MKKIALSWILSCFVAKGLLNRAHAYKAAVDINTASGKSPDAEVNAGLFNYPILMAADILLYGSHIVPVGQDQKQHVEIARDIAMVINNKYGNILTLPQPLIQEEAMIIPGIDGRKMSKNYNNTIGLFADAKTRHKQVMGIVTDSKKPEDQKNPDECNVFTIYRYFATCDAIETKRKLYLNGGLAYSDIKKELFDLLEDRFSESRDIYLDLVHDHTHLDDVLNQGAEKARSMAGPKMDKLRRRIGIKRLA